MTTYFFFRDLIAVTGPYDVNDYTNSFFDGICDNLAAGGDLDAFFTNSDNWTGAARD